MHDVLKYSTIMNIFSSTSADRFMMSCFMNLANEEKLLLKLNLPSDQNKLTVKLNSFF